MEVLFAGHQLEAMEGKDQIKKQNKIVKQLKKSI